MLTICWAAKGGSGTSVVAAATALTAAHPTLLVDLAGDLPALLGLPDPEAPGVHDWLRSDAEPARLEHLVRPVADGVALLPAGTVPSTDDRDRHDGVGGGANRWAALAATLARRPGCVVVDVGTARPPDALRAHADHAWLVTRPCYLSLRAAVRQAARPSGVVLIEEPGRSLGPADIELAVGAPIVARLLLDPAVARAVDAGLLVSRLPVAYRRRLAEAA